MKLAALSETTTSGRPSVANVVLNEELEKCVKSCEACQVNRKSQPAAPMHAWTWPSKPWSRIHIDYAGPFMGKMFLVIIDAHSKWMEVHKTASSSAAATIHLSIYITSGKAFHSADPRVSFMKHLEDSSFPFSRYDYSALPQHTPIFHTQLIPSP